MNILAFLMCEGVFPMLPPLPYPQQEGEPLSVTSAIILYYVESVTQS